MLPETETIHSVPRLFFDSSFFVSWYLKYNV
jgi:hypothetical protein